MHELAEFRIARDGRYLDANPAGLALLGVTIEELRTYRVGDFAPEEFRAAVRANWEALRGRNPKPVVGVSPVVRPSGEVVLARLISPRLVEPDVYVARGELANDAPHPLEFRPLRDILDRWRQAERQFGRLGPDDPRRGDLARDIEALRTLYQFANEMKLSRG